MNWETWRPFYLRIVREMGYSIEEDRKSAELLRSLLLESDDYILREELGAVIGRKVYVFGAGPSLERALNEFDFSDGTLIAADGATTALLDFGIIPDVIVTDLDGRISDIKLANDRGAFLVVHAHGDNRDKLVSYVPFLSRILGTCQTEPLDIIYNFGGFTDGDRAAFLAKELGAREITLVGFDFGETVGKWSKPSLREHSPIWESKRKKFEFAKELLAWLEKNGRAKIKTLTPSPPQRSEEEQQERGRSADAARTL
ncbi:6-hydroxymethylpterin diphosphokinase MptE-like protein [Thermococcus sp. AM4]|uniref:6-hydroxymethylpterin diphosphokinase MptE-like protein n=1 Tax=Thermococcus sp. (strain AM4) TaxID=246969 RepID=UPI00064E4FF0|nr:6-hydroxymethylpterin diphosphokinase MptE-like protein [Thermococcus sp. AM4]